MRCAAKNRVTLTDLGGTTVVLDRHDGWKVLALNRLDDSFAASAAIVGDELFLRGKRSLYCLSEVSGD